MDKRKALELLKQALIEIPKLRKLHYNNQEFKLWQAKVGTIIKEGLAADDYESLDFVQAKYFPDELEIDHLSLVEDYLPRLNDYETALKSIIQKYEILGIETTLESTTREPSTVDKPKALISHGKEKRLFEKAWKIEIRGDDIATLYPIVRTVASELRLENFAFEARPAKSITTNSYAWFNVLIINTTTASKIPVGAFTLQKLPESNTIELRVPPPSEWGRYDLNPSELAVKAYSRSQYNEHFLEFIKSLENRLKDDGLIVTWHKKLCYEVKDFVATIIAKFIAEKTK